MIFVSELVLNHFLLQIFGVILNLRRNSTGLQLFLLRNPVQFTPIQSHTYCKTFVVTLAARCQTLSELQQCPLPPPRIDRQCGQIASTIACTPEAPLNQPTGQRYYITTQLKPKVISAIMTLNVQ